MITEHVLLYLGARLIAAAVSLGAVAIFTRLAASDVYGDYLLVFAWAFVIYGIFAQWLGAAFFGVYKQEEAAPQIAALARLFLGSIILGSTFVSIGAACGLITWPMAGALCLTVCGLSLFTSVMEAGRTRLQARTVSIIYVLRAGFIITFGTVTLLLGGGGLSLAVALASANIVAALPGLARLSPHLIGAPKQLRMRPLLNFGWPLILAYGLAALGQNIDRLILAHMGSTAELGPYGATADLLKQSFSVVAEAIVLAAVSMAKDASTRGDEVTAKHTLEDVARALTAAVSFGAVFFLSFADELVDLVFGLEFRGTARALMPWLVGAGGALTFRAYYFGQAIYFGQSSRNEVVAAILMFAVTGTLSLAAIPYFGAFGAACAAIAGQLAACAVYIRARPRMPIPAAGMLVIAATAAAAFGISTVLDQIELLNRTTRLLSKLLVIGGCGLFVIWRFNLLALKDYVSLLARRHLFCENIDANARTANHPQP